MRKSHESFYRTEPAIPQHMKQTQEWFSDVITGPLENNYISSLTPSGFLIAEEASKYIVPSPHLRPHQRIQIYNQQYWWRLLNTLHDNFPLVVRLFGYQAFNEQIGIPYLLKYPPNHWSLNLLGERLSKWISEEYHAQDLPFVQNATQLDWAFHESFISPQKTKLDLNSLANGGDPTSFLSLKLFLQPHIFLFKWDYDLLTFREKCIAEDGDYWIDHSFPELNKSKTYHYVLFRNQKGLVTWKEISEAEFLLLQTLRQGATINEACEFLEKQRQDIYDQAENHLQEWFQTWTLRQWLTEDNTPSKIT